MQKHTIDKFQKIFNQYNFHFIILSCHQIDTRNSGNKIFKEAKTKKNTMKLYYQEILYMVKYYKNYSYLDIIKRYDEISDYPFEKVKAIITDILNTVIADERRY